MTSGAQHAVDRFWEHRFLDTEEDSDALRALSMEVTHNAHEINKHLRAKNGLAALMKIVEQVGKYREEDRDNAELIINECMAVQAQSQHDDLGVGLGPTSWSVLGEEADNKRAAYEHTVHVRPSREWQQWWDTCANNNIRNNGGGTPEAGRGRKREAREEAGAAFDVDVTMPPSISDPRKSPIPLILWPCSLLLSNLLVSNPSIVKNKRVLEIGAGFHGVIALTCARSGCSSLVTTDCDNDALYRMKHNIGRNNTDGHADCVEVRKLNWEKLDEYFLRDDDSENEADDNNKKNNKTNSNNLVVNQRPHEPTCPLFISDATTTSVKLPRESPSESAVRMKDKESVCTHAYNDELFDVIIGSDIIHEIPMALLVEQTIRRFLRPDGLCVIMNAQKLHRFGVAEFQHRLMHEAPDLLCTIDPVEDSMTAQVDVGDMFYDVYTVCYKRRRSKI